MVVKRSVWWPKESTIILKKSRRCQNKKTCSDIVGFYDNSLGKFFDSVAHIDGLIDHNGIKMGDRFLQRSQQSSMVA